MEENKIHIKNMVCPRCVSAVKRTLTEMQIPFTEVKLGEVVLAVDKKEIDKELFDKKLHKIGFELIDDEKSHIVSQIKTEIIKYIHYSPDLIRKVNFSDYLADKIGHNYSYLSRLFSSVEVQTIEKYIIQQKIEKVKELLIYEELSLSEISYDLDYSSVQHLSRQFKNVTGMTPTEFKKLEKKNRRPLNEI
ncbi:MAG: helix-turn-helix domain-containing protein [Chlorobi bacterium]|nr:helix-turn-helix domain-containing protein [Chlorobiota bacterium]